MMVARIARNRRLLGAGLLVALLALIVVLVPVFAAARADSATPAAGFGGTAFRFTAGGFNSEERVNYWAQAPDGEVYGTREFEVHATAQGVASWSWQARPDALPGLWLMVARGRDSQVEQVIRFEILPSGAAPPAASPTAAPLPGEPVVPPTAAPLPGEPVVPPAASPTAAPLPGEPVVPPTAAPLPGPPPSQQFNVAPPAAPAGASFAFFAIGFQHGERVGFWVNTPDGRVLGSDDYAVLAYRERADWTWQAPANAQPGTWQMVVRGQRSGVQHVIPFVIH
jgi:hypothetical protein